MRQISMSEPPEISVVMSCYNASRWLKPAIDSVLAQTFHDFELILVNDGSTDETWGIINDYRKIDGRVVAISKENTGLADSLNVGISLARGSWVARLDADDICEPSRLEKQINFVRENPEVVLLGTGFFEIDENGKRFKKHSYPTEHQRLVKNLEQLRRFFPHSSAFYRTDVVRQVGGYNLRIQRAEDRKLWLDLSLRGRIAALPTPQVQIRKHANQISLDNDGKRQLCDAIASTVSYFLMKAGRKDPSVEASENEWRSFLSWIEKRAEELDIFNKRKSWISARDAYFSTENKIIAGLRFSTRLLQSGYACVLIWEKFFETSLSQRLARDWVVHSTPIN